MNVGPTGLADKLDSRLSKKEEPKPILRFETWQCGRMGFPSADMRRTVDGDGLRRKIRG